MVIVGSWIIQLRGRNISVDPLNLIQIILAEGKNIEKRFSTKLIAEVAMVVALSTVLSFIKIYHLPQGGSITAGSMVPLIWVSLRRGPRIGLFTCFIYGLVQFMIEPWAMGGPIQVLLDYPFAFGALGLAGFFQRYPLIGVGVGIGGRFVSHFLSGIYFWWALYGPPEMNPAVYSLIYNGSYLFGELIVSAILTYLIIKRGILEIYP
jgi:thiamine transporter